MLEQANFAYAYASEVNFDNSNLTACNGVNADFAFSSFVGSVLDKANMVSASFWEAQLTDASMIETDFSAAQMEGAFLCRVVACRTKFNEAVLDGSSFHAAKLHEADFREASIVDCHFTEEIISNCIGLNK
jgi:uncharacterized protein YjbI with pentapeptide repeats